MAANEIQIRTLDGGQAAELRVVTSVSGELTEPLARRLRDLGYCVLRPYVVETERRRILHARLRHHEGFTITAGRAATVIGVLQGLLTSGREDSVVAPLPGAAASGREWLAVGGGGDGSSMGRPPRDTCAA